MCFRAGQLMLAAGIAARLRGDPDEVPTHLAELDQLVRGALRAGLVDDRAAASLFIAASRAAYASAWLGWFEKAPSQARLAEFVARRAEGLWPDVKDQLAEQMRAQLAGSGLALAGASEAGG